MAEAAETEESLLLRLPSDAAAASLYVREATDYASVQ